MAKDSHDKASRGKGKDKDKAGPDRKPAKERKEIPLVSVPNEDDLIAQEMADLFEEDQVTHKHGSAEPEGD